MVIQNTDKKEKTMKCNDCGETATEEINGMSFCVDCAEEYEQEE